jgi:hypothetical protein
MSEKELEQEVVVQDEAIEEAKASFGVDAEVPEPTTKENTPPGAKPEDEDKNKNPEQGSSVKPTKVKAVNKIVDVVKGMKNEEVQKLLAMLEGREEVEADEIAETIKMSELRQVTAEDVDVAEDVAAMFKGEELSEDFIKHATTIFEAAVVSKVNEILENVTVDMEAEIQAIKLASLAEGVEFEDADTYADKLETIKESYFGEEVELSEEVNMDEEIVEIEEESSEPTLAPEMSSYMNAIAKSIKK